MLLYIQSGTQGHHSNLLACFLQVNLAGDSHWVLEVHRSSKFRYVPRLGVCLWDQAHHQKGTKGWGCGSIGRRLPSMPRVEVAAPHKPAVVVQPVIPALKRWRQEDQTFKVISKASLGCVRPCLLQKGGMDTHSRVRMRTMIEQDPDKAASSRKPLSQRESAPYHPFLGLTARPLSRTQRRCSRRACKETHHRSY